MSYLKDKVPCSVCGCLFDIDQLNLDNVCRDCVIDEEMLQELNDDYANDLDDC